MSLLARNRNFRLLFTSSAISNLGDGISALAFPWLATLMTRDPVLIAAVAAASKLPWLLFTAPAGVIADRMDRQRILVWSDCVRTGLTALVILLIFTLPTGEAHVAQVWALAALAFLLGMAEYMRKTDGQQVVPA